MPGIGTTGWLFRVKHFYALIAILLKKAGC